VQLADEYMRAGGKTLPSALIVATTVIHSQEPSLLARQASLHAFTS
jgi:hypothetical protein